MVGGSAINGRGKRDSTKFLIGERVYLRPIEPEDLPLVRKWANDPEIRRLTGETLPMSQADADGFLEKVGFRKEGLQRDGYYYDHAYHDFVMMSLLEDEFRQLHGERG